MITPHENYEQDKVKGEEKQTVILNEGETGETDELDPKFHEDGAGPERSEAPEEISEDDAVDGEEDQFLQTGRDADLNHGLDDDLSLNKPTDDLF